VSAVILSKYRRTRETRQTLNQDISKHTIILRHGIGIRLIGETHKKPKAKRIKSRIFCLFGNWTLKIMGIGKRYVRKSVMTCMYVVNHQTALAWQ